MQCRDVHADPLGPARLPSSRSPDALVDHPFADRHDETRPFRNRGGLGRDHRATCAICPSQQGPRAAERTRCDPGVPVCRHYPQPLGSETGRFVVEGAMAQLAIEVAPEVVLLGHVAERCHDAVDASPPSQTPRPSAIPAIAVSIAWRESSSGDSSFPSIVTAITSSPAETRCKACRCCVFGRTLSRLDDRRRSPDQTASWVGTCAIVTAPYG